MVVFRRRSSALAVYGVLLLLFSCSEKPQVANLDIIAEGGVLAKQGENKKTSHLTSFRRRMGLFTALLGLDLRL